MNSLLKKTSAWLPLALSGFAFVFVLVYVAVFGVSTKSSADEGLPARAFQLIVGVQVLIVVFFVARWLPHKPRETLQVLGLQVAAMALVVGLVVYFEM